MIRIAQSYKRLTRSNPEFSAPHKPPNIFTLAEKIANISDISIRPMLDNPKFKLKKTKPIGKFNHLIEEFSILGVNNEDIMTPIKDFQGLTNEIKMDPTILYHNSWKKDSKPLPCLKDFLFPFGYEINILDRVNLDKLIENHVTRDTVQHDSNKFYFFKLNSESTITNETGCDSSVLKESNPNLFYNYYCIFTEALHCIVSSSLVKFFFNRIETWR